MSARFLAVAILPTAAKDGPCLETVQVKKHAKNRIGDDRLPQRARRFFVAHKRDAKRPKDDNSKDYPHPNHVRGLAECDVQNVSGCLSEFYVE